MTPERAAKRRARNGLIMAVAAGSGIVAAYLAPQLMPIPIGVALLAVAGWVHYGSWLMGYEAGMARAASMLRHPGVNLGARRRLRDIEGTILETREHNIGNTNVIDLSGVPYGSPAGPVAPATGDPTA